jgi:metallophosphoesterase superfamily enzyme
VLLRGAARSSLRLPCFVFGESRAILPSFGAFTGSTVVKPAKGERVFVVGNGAVYPV